VENVHLLQGSKARSNRLWSEGSERVAKKGAPPQSS
jgi:hypothetical protein